MESQSIPGAVTHASSFISASSQDTIAWIETVYELEDLSAPVLVTSESVYRHVRRDRVSSRKARALMERESLTVQVLPDDALSGTVALSEETVYVRTAAVSDGVGVGWVPGADHELTDATEEAVIELVETATDPSQSLPDQTWPELLEGLATELGDDFAIDVEGVAYHRPAIAGPAPGGVPLHAIVTVVGANHDHTLRKLGQVMERFDIGSRSAASQDVDALEDANAVTREKVKDGSVGRPAHRLHLTDDIGTEPSALVELLQQELA